MRSEDNFYDHYKDSYNVLKAYLAKRDRLTIIIFVMIIVILFQVESPVNIESIFNSLWAENIADTPVEFKYINSLLNIGFLWFVMQYYQIVLTIENSYKYIHELESELSRTESFTIKREGVNYLKSYPWLKSLTHRIFLLLLPVIIIATSVIKAIVECINNYEFKIVDCVVLGLVVLMTMLYLSNRCFYEDAFNKKRYPGISYCKRFKAYFCKKRK